MVAHQRAYQLAEQKVKEKQEVAMKAKARALELKKQQ